MNKNECVNYCADKIKKSWEQHGGPKDYMKRRAVFEHCKEVCKTNGYTGMCFVGIWNKATTNALEH